MNIDFYRATLAHHGLGATLLHAVYRAANAVVPLAIWDAMVITPDAVDRAFRSPPQRATGRMLAAEEMRRYVDDHANDLTHAFVDEASAKGDRCYAMFEGDTLAGYGWYSTQPTRLNEISRELVLRFDPRFAYMYHGYTHPDHRGRRLHAIGKVGAIDQLAREGLSGLVSYVDCSNFASLKSCARLGYRTIGHIALVRIKGRFASSTTRGCRKYGVRIERVNVRPSLPPSLPPIATQPI